jgi:hypothetical protein
MGILMGSAVPRGNDPVFAGSAGGLRLDGQLDGPAPEVVRLEFAAFSVKSMRHDSKG